MLRLLSFLFLLCAVQGIAHESEPMEVVVVEGRQLNLLGDAISAGEGVVGQRELQLRPLLRTGEILEAVPGMVVTQHSGTGKANQLFLRGFNLDHGTDFATFVDGMPVNMRTHGHGQGYTDLNFLIPELVGRINYKKGAYYADVGDFSGAGSAQMVLADSLRHGFVDTTVGEDNYLRLLAAQSYSLDSGELLVAIERSAYDGPWRDIDEDVKKTNGLLKHSWALESGRLSLTAMAYDNSWNSADQIPSRAVEQGIIDELGSLDDTVGGESSRYSLSADWEGDALGASLYVIDYELNLWSNFTYFLDDEASGDQFEQVDDRLVYGGLLNYSIEQNGAERAMTNRVGIEWRVDDIDEVGLYRSDARNRLGAVRSDAVTETSVGAFVENRTQWTERLHSTVGLRYDYFDFDVDDRVGTNSNGVNLAPNSGSSSDDIVSLKGSLVYALNEFAEIYVSAGQGFHSNDARGTTIKVDPVDGGAVVSVDPLVRSEGYEVGVRGYVLDTINASLSLWSLELDSELLFVGDAGNTEASRATERSGVELSLYYNLSQDWTLDLEYAYSDAAFSDASADGDKIPGAIRQVVQAGISADLENGWFGSLRLRHFGERPLLEDNSVKSGSTTIWNMRAGYQRGHWVLRGDLLNLLDSDDHDIDYFYESRLASEPSGVGTEDVHYHVIEPRTARLSVIYKFS